MDDSSFFWFTFGPIVAITTGYRSGRFFPQVFFSFLNFGEFILDTGVVFVIKAIVAKESPTVKFLLLRFSLVLLLLVETLPVVPVDGFLFRTLPLRMVRVVDFLLREEAKSSSSSGGEEKSFFGE